MEQNLKITNLDLMKSSLQQTQSRNTNIKYTFSWYNDKMSACDRKIANDECETDQRGENLHVQLRTETIASYTNVYYRNCSEPEMLGVGN